MSTILVTRPQTEAGATAEKITALGHKAVISSVLRVEAESFEIPAEDRSIIVTSRNGVRLGLPNIEDKDRPIFAVGEQTANEAKKLGFTNVTVGPGTAKKLVSQLADTDKSQKYTHLCGRDLAFDVADALTGRGFDAESAVTYQTVSNQRLEKDVEDALNEGAIDVALFYSPRTATIFEETVAAYGRSDWLANMDAYCLSTRVVSNLLGPWKTKRYAVIPTEKAMLNLLGSV